MEGNRRSPQRLRRAVVHLRMFIVQHDRAPVDVEAGMHHFPVGARQTNEFARIERTLVEFDGVRRAGARQVRRDGLQTAGGCFLCRNARSFSHFSSP